MDKEWHYVQWLKSKEQRFHKSLTEAFLGLKMNVSHETGAEKKGWSGTFFWRSYLDGRIIGVYKPSDQDSLSPGSPNAMARFRYGLIPGSNRVLVSQSGKCHIGEAGARIAANHFHKAFLSMKGEGIEVPCDEEDALVPDTRIVEMGFSSGATEQGIGSLQLFLERCLPLTEAFGVKKTFQLIKGSPNVDRLLPQYQWLKLLHFLIFSQDDHAENTLAVRNTRGEIDGLKAIDNGLSFTAKRWENGFVENSVLSMKPLYGLRHHLARKPLLPFFRQFLLRFSSEGHLDRLSEEIRALYQNPLNYPEGHAEPIGVTNERIALLRERFGEMKRLLVKERRPLESLLVFQKGESP